MPYAPPTVLPHLRKTRCNAGNPSPLPQKLRANPSWQLRPPSPLPCQGNTVSPTHRLLSCLRGWQPPCLLPAGRPLIGEQPSFPQGDPGRREGDPGPGPPTQETPFPRGGEFCKQVASAREMEETTTQSESYESELKSHCDLHLPVPPKAVRGPVGAGREPEMSPGWVTGS